MSLTTEPTSLHDYFAANAPADPPDWFQPEMEHLPLPEKPQGVDCDGFDQAAFEWRKAVRQVKDQRSEYRYFAWRWYYAEQMSKSRPSVDILKGLKDASR